MIILAIVAILLIFAGIGTSASYFAYRDEISQIHEESAATINQRVKEDLTIEYDAEGSVSARVQPESAIRGMMIRCGGTGMLHTEPVPEGFDHSHSQYDAVMERLRSACA